MTLVPTKIRCGKKQKNRVISLRFDFGLFDFIASYLAQLWNSKKLSGTYKSRTRIRARNRGFLPLLLYLSKSLNDTGATQWHSSFGKNLKIHYKNNQKNTHKHVCAKAQTQDLRHIRGENSLDPSYHHNQRPVEKKPQNPLPKQPKEHPQTCVRDSTQIYCLFAVRIAGPFLSQ